MARGIAAGVVAFVVGAWAVGLALGNDEPVNRETGPDVPETSLTPSEEPSVMGEVEDRPRKATDRPTEADPGAETSDAVDDPETDEPVDDRDPRTPRPSPKPTRTPRPSPSGTPTKTPSPTPSDRECDELREVLDCVLAPVTTRP